MYSIHARYLMEYVLTPEYNTLDSSRYMYKYNVRRIEEQRIAYHSSLLFLTSIVLSRFIIPYVCLRTLEN